MKKVVVLFVSMILIFSVTGCSVKKTAELTDAEKFANEYSISVENPFKYATLSEVLNLVQNDSGILFLGDSDSEWSTFGVQALNKVVTDAKIDEVYYFNPETVRNKDSKQYKNLAELLQLDEESSLPIVYVIVDGKVVDHVDYPIHDDTSIDDRSINQLEDEYSDLISLYM